MATAPHLLVQEKDRIVTLVLNRPEVLNAMSIAMIEQLYAQIMRIQTDENIRLVIIKGAGEHFCSGADMHLFDQDRPPYEWLKAMKNVGQLVLTLRQMPQIVITELQGVAVGGGANLALAGDFVVAADNARFCEIFINIGAILDYGGHYFLPRLVGLAKARELALLGEEISGETAASLGLIYKSVPQAQLEREVQALAAKLIQRPKFALALIKEGLEKSIDMSMQEVLNWEAAHQSVALQTPEHKEIVRLFLKSKAKT